MFKGKNKCRILRKIRAEIAKNNGVDYVIEECKHKGDCTGTCPKCESEVRALERELEARRNAGKRVLLAGVAAGIALTGAACTPDAPGVEAPSSAVSTAGGTVGSEQTPVVIEVPVLTPEAPAVAETELSYPMGDVAYPTAVTVVKTVPQPDGTVTIVFSDGREIKGVRLRTEPMVNGGPIFVSFAFSEEETKAALAQIREYVENADDGMPEDRVLPS